MATWTLFRRMLLPLEKYLGRLADLGRAVRARAADQRLELLQQEVAHREVARVLVAGLQLERVASEVIELAAPVRVLDQQVAARADRSVARRDDRAGDLGGVVLVEVLHVLAEVHASARGAHRCTRLIRRSRGAGLDQDRPGRLQPGVPGVGEE